MKKEIILLLVLILILSSPTLAYITNSTNYKVNLALNNYGNYNDNSTNNNVDFSLTEMPVGKLIKSNYQYANIGFYFYEIISNRFYIHK